LEHQTIHAACFNARGLLYECVIDALLFSSSYRPVGKPVSHQIVTRSTFSSLLFWTIIPAILPAMMLKYYSRVHLRCPLKFFLSSFRSIGSLLPIGRHSTSNSARLQTGRLLKLNCSFFFFGPTCMLFDLSIALRLRHDLSKVAAHTPHPGACETWVPLGPHRPGSQPSPTSGSGLLEDSPTCQ
jgi:hypothetical protein